MAIKDGAYCPGCGLPNYEGLCPVCRGDEAGYEQELAPFFGPWFDDEPSGRGAVTSSSDPDHESEKSDG